MKCVFAHASQSDSNQCVSNSSWKFICSLLQVMILTSNLASPPVILRNKPAQRFKWLPFSILEHIWHMTQAFHSRLKAPVHITSFCQRSSQTVQLLSPPPSSSSSSSSSSTTLPPPYKGLYNFRQRLQKNAPTILNEIILSPPVWDPENDSALPGRDRKR